MITPINKQYRPRIQPEQVTAGDYTVNHVLHGRPKDNELVAVEHWLPSRADNLSKLKVTCRPT
jgi:hypothetical protein